MFYNFGIVILAAGQGKRLGCVDLPKVLLPIGGRPILSYILETLEKGGIPKGNICLVVGFKSDKVEETAGKKYVYARQAEQLGTAHAAHTGEMALPAEIDNFLVLNGDDSVFYEFESLKKLINAHLKSKNVLTLLTCRVGDPSLLGRVVRDENKKLKAVVEKENITEEMKEINETSTGTFCFNREWFKKTFPKLKLIPILNECGLPLFIDEANIERAAYDAVILENPDEWFGINTPEQLEEANRRKYKQEH
ncbi:MAG: sugar phosphate nucleotidyltransferase [Patescibacteria group bacterium]|jgi:bifunctional UDP-N-acetylglucosamine pyrophosphorylase/glucosamine-1-phosphate N-acetyltransferase